MAFKMKGFAGFKSNGDPKKERLTNKKNRLVNRMDKDDEGIPTDSRKNKRLSKRHQKTIAKLVSPAGKEAAQNMSDILHKGKIYRK